MRGEETFQDLIDINPDDDAGAVGRRTGGLTGADFTKTRSLLAQGVDEA